MSSFRAADERRLILRERKIKSVAVAMAARKRVSAVEEPLIAMPRARVRSRGAGGVGRPPAGRPRTRSEGQADGHHRTAPLPADFANERLAQRQ